MHILEKVIAEHVNKSICFIYSILGTNSNIYMCKFRQVAGFSFTPILVLDLSQRPKNQEVHPRCEQGDCPQTLAL